MLFKHAATLFLAVSLSFSVAALPLACPPVAGSIARRVDGRSLGSRSLARRQDDAPPQIAAGDASSDFDVPPQAGPSVENFDGASADRTPSDDSAAGSSADSTLESSDDGSDEPAFGDQSFGDEAFDDQSFGDEDFDEDDGSDFLEERGERQPIAIRQSDARGKAGATARPSHGHKQGNKGVGGKFNEVDDLGEQGLEPRAPNVDPLPAEAPLVHSADLSTGDGKTAEVAFTAILSEACSNAISTVTVTNTVTLAAQVTGKADVHGKDGNENGEVDLRVQDRAEQGAAASASGAEMLGA